MQQTGAIYIDERPDTVTQEPELRTIVDSLRDVVERLEMRGQELMSFEAKISSNGATPATGLRNANEPTDNYAKDLHSLLGRLRVVEEEQLTPAVTFLRAFL